MIITIGGTFGSGGKGVAERLTELLGYKFCDDELVTEVVKDIDPDMQQRTFAYFDESQGSASITDLKQISKAQIRTKYNILASVLTNDVIPLDRKMAELQEELINKLADEDNVILMGRSANYYLRGRENCIRVFCDDDIDNRIKRISEIHGVTEKEARKLIEKTDSRRADYYAFFTGGNWGSLKYYDMKVNIRTMGIEETAQMIKALVDIKNE